MDGYKPYDAHPKKSERVRTVTRQGFAWKADLEKNRRLREILKIPFPIRRKICDDFSNLWRTGRKSFQGLEDGSL
jgi:hypothetical protein